MVYTSYFAKLNKIREQYPDIEPICIARYSPKNIKIRRCQQLYPTPELISGYKTGRIGKEEYTKTYIDVVLGSLDTKNVYEVLDGKCMVCYEKSGDFCHRYIISKWLEDAGYHCEELVFNERR
jgi:hypothetical protein